MGDNFRRTPPLSKYLNFIKHLYRPEKTGCSYSFPTNIALSNFHNDRKMVCTKKTPSCATGVGWHLLSVIKNMTVRLKSKSSRAKEPGFFNFVSWCHGVNDSHKLGFLLVQSLYFGVSLNGNGYGWALNKKRLSFLAVRCLSRLPGKTSEV